MTNASADQRIVGLFSTSNPSRSEKGDRMVLIAAAVVILIVNFMHIVSP